MSGALFLGDVMTVNRHYALFQINTYCTCKLAFVHVLPFFFSIPVN